MPNQAPIVNVNDQTVLINGTIAATELFSVTDPDSDPILKYRFEDLSSNANSGYFSLNGSALTNGSMTEINAGDLADMFYVGGTQIQNEQFRVRAWDGTAWSSLDNTAVLYTTRQQITPPVAVATNFSVLANESVAANSFVSASDPDGYPILRYYIRDDKVDNSYFKVGDTRLAEGSFHYINASQFDNLHYYGFGNSSERIRVFAYDGSTWSSVSLATATTVENKNAPTMEFQADIVPTRELVSVDPYLTLHDADGNSIKSVRFWDTSDHDHSGYLMLDGTPLASKQWHEIAYSDLGGLQYMGADRMMDERIAVRVYDGKYWSPTERVTLSTVFKPELAEVRQIFSTQLENWSVSEMYAQLDAGPSVSNYQIMDLTSEGNFSDTSGHLSYAGSRLDVGEVYDFTTSQLNNLNFVAAPYEARVDDQLYARAYNGVFWSDWTRVTVSTHPEYDKALTSGATWTDYNWNILPEPYHVTYSFMHQVPDYDSGEASDSWHSQFNLEQRSTARFAFNQVATYCGLTFEEVSDSSFQEKTGHKGGIIRMGNYSAGEAIASTLAYAYLPGPEAVNGDIWINRFSTNDDPDPANWTGALFDDDFSIGDIGYATFIHELGHAIGLKHPFEGNSILPQATDSSEYTVMSYTGRSDGINSFTHGIYDIFEMQQLYGANMTHATGDDVYSIANTWDSQRGTWAIWDADGSDTLSAEGSGSAAIVDLREGRLSTIGTAVQDNIGIAIGCAIENAIGSSSNDTIFGNAYANVIEGGAGSDEIYGFGGNDTLTGGADNDTFVVGVADGHDLILEKQLAGWDTVEFREFPGFDDFTEDLSFRAVDRDLVIEYTQDGGRSQGSVTINNQQWGSYRVETLRIGDAVVDLNSVYSQCTADLQQFTLDAGSTKYGSLVVPV